MFPPPAQLLFTNAEPHRLSAVLTDLGINLAEWQGWSNPYNCLLVDTGDHRVLVDTGAGELGPDTGRLLRGLEAEGVGPEEIDVIIHTHAHYDHIGGNTDGGGNIAFPNARWVMSEAEWQSWMGGEAERVLPDDLFGGVKALLLGYCQKNLGPTKSCFRLAQGREEMVPGVEVVPTPGHSPGHIAVVLSSGDEKLFCLGDVCLHEGHMREPEWTAALDMVPPLAASTRRSILAQAADEDARVFFVHFPFPGVGRAIPSGSGWRWQPDA
jgi:glyoxylase-like metal-dependent hydrolase (beta-lactamase superfamily II)